MTYIKSEPLVKRLFLVTLGVMTIVCAIFSILQFNQLNSIHKEQVKTIQRIVGAVVKEYPEEEIDIIETIFKDESEETQKLGEDVLRKYGYGLNMKISNDKTFVEFIKSFIEFNLLMIMLILVINIFLVIFVLKNVGSYFEYVSNALDEFVKGRYVVKECNLSNGAISRVSNQLKHVADAIVLKEQRLSVEKESSQELVTDISHQLKTPLASLDMCNSILMDETLSDEERLEFLTSSRVSINKLQALINVLVNISRLEAEMIKIKKEKCSIRDTLTKAISGIYMKALKKEIDIEVSEFIDEEINHDSKWTEEAIFNVLENAVKYTRSGGSIRVGVAANINYVRITIKDNGIGIKKDAYNDIFKRFYRGNEASVKAEEGSGVGLYLARKIIEEQGGSIMVKSKIHVGSEFSILLRRD